MTVEMIDENLREGMSFKDAKGIIRDVLEEMHTQHLYVHPERDRPTVSLLIGLWTKEDGCKLLATNKTAVNEVKRYKSIGVGTILADCLTQVFYSDDVDSCEAAALVASCVFSLVKAFVQSCGGETDIVAIMSDGTVKTAVSHRVVAVESFFFEFLSGVKHVLAYLTVEEENHDVPEQLMEDVVEEVNRFAQDRRREPLFLRPASKKSLPKSSGS